MARAAIIALAVVIVAAIGLLGMRAVANREDGSATVGVPGISEAATVTAAQPTTQVTVAQVPPVTVTVPPPTTVTAVSNEQAAKNELDQMLLHYGTQVPLNGQWVAMLSGKWIGIVDPLQTNQQGSHVFGAADILAEHNAIKTRVTGVQVVLLDSRTFGEHINHNGDPLYVTVALSDSFHDRESVLAWCAAQFPEYSGQTLENHCTSSHLTP